MNNFQNQTAEKPFAIGQRRGSYQDNRHILVFLIQITKTNLISVLRLTIGVSDGGYGSEATPVPIPNTEVKLICADGTAWATAWKSRSPPSRTPYFIIILI